MGSGQFKKAERGLVTRVPHMKNNKDPMLKAIFD